MRLRLVVRDWAIILVALSLGAIGIAADLLIGGGQPGFGWKQAGAVLAALCLLGIVGFRGVRRAGAVEAPRRRELRNIILLVLASSVSGLGLAELLLRGLVEPSERSYGRLFGLELPPVTVIPCERPTGVNSTAWFEGLVEEGRRITDDDLKGLKREDPLLGYVPRENAVSSNGWWQSNNLGARARRDTAMRKPAGARRILVLGDSFAAGSRVPQEAAWSSVLEERFEDVEIVNLAVDGFSMGQSLLRYRHLPEQLEYDLVLLVFVPNASLWREINTIRNLGEGWPSFTVMPRFVLEHDRLVLAQSPYPVPTSVYESNCGRLSDELREHLRKYDRFYSSAVYEPSFLTDRLVVSKLIASAWHQLRRKQLLAISIDMESEAMRVIHEIFRVMDREVRRHGANFALVLLPNNVEVSFLRESHPYADEWKEMAAAFSREGLLFFDLSEELVRQPEESLDSGFDGSHYGPQANVIVADSLARHLKALSW